VVAAIILALFGVATATTGLIEAVTRRPPPSVVWRALYPSRARLAAADWSDERWASNGRRSFVVGVLLLVLASLVPS
jgi:hypothetical protein